jgi:hypothetical protein
MSQLNDTRRSILATLDEIVIAEHGTDISDPFEWMQLRDIVARIERRLAQQMPAKVPAE